MTANHERIESAIQRVLGFMLALIGAFLLGIAVSLRNSVAVLGATSVLAPYWLVLIIGLALMALSVAARRIKPPVLLAIVSFWLSVAIGLAFTIKAKDGGSPIIVRSQLVRPAGSTVTYYEAWTGDKQFYRHSSILKPNLGYDFTPGSVAHQKFIGEYDVEYHIDAEGNRLIPDHRPRVVFAGCSFTFGQGVRDEEAYPALVAHALAPSIRVVNSANLGWGTNHALVICEEELAKSPPPVAFFYGFIHDHVQRNYLRKEAHRFSGDKNPFPYFDTKDGKLVFEGMMNHGDANAPSDRETVEKEIEITHALIKQLADRCNSQGVIFRIVLLNIGPLGWRSLPSWLRSEGIPFIDATSIPRNSYPEDGHPTAVWHRAVAKLLLDDQNLISEIRAKANPGHAP